MRTSSISDIPAGTGTSYPSFLRELETLLSRNGIIPHRQPVTAGIHPKENRTGSDSDSQLAVGRVVIYIEEHLAEQLSLEKLAEEARLSKYQLIRRFRAERGATPWQYLIERRIERARELLKEGVPPGEVAVETGFYDQSHLHRTFQEETGHTPKEYQERHSDE